MAEPFIGQIQPLAFDFAPRGWARCDGQLLPISQNNALFSLLGTTYGGDGRTTFALPNLQSRVPLKFGVRPGGGTYVLGEEGGSEQVTLTMSTMPEHNHLFIGTSADGNSVAPAAGQILGTSTGGAGNPDMFYGSDSSPQPLNPGSMSATGSGQPHTNIQPYLTINWCIAMQGLFPSRN